MTSCSRCGADWVGCNCGKDRGALPDDERTLDMLEHVRGMLTSPEPTQDRVEIARRAEEAASKAAEVYELVRLAFAVGKDPYVDEGAEVELRERADKLKEREPNAVRVVKYAYNFGKSMAEEERRR